MKWNKHDLKRLKLANNYTEKTQNITTVIPKTKISVEKETIKKVLWVLHREKVIPDYTEELQFHPKRKFRFDWAIPELNLGIEYEGIFSKKSRHTTVSGYSKDVEKYNLATVNGWRILRYTAKNYLNLEDDLKKITKN